MIKHQKPGAFLNKFFRKPDIQKESTHYCPGCGHGIIHKLIAEAVSDLKIKNKTIIVCPVGCAVFMYYYYDCSSIQAAHGRAPAIATAASRLLKDSVVISYQGDGDLAAIGTAEIIHAANRGENMTVLFVNNGIYGMTGGQLAPTTLMNKKTTTSPYGRGKNKEGKPIKMAEMIATLEAPVFVARTSVYTPKDIMTARKYIRLGLKNQLQKKGFSFVEILSPCPTNLKMNLKEIREHYEKQVRPYYKTAVLKNEESAPEDETIKKISFDKIADKMFFPPTALKADLKKPLKIKIAGFGGQGVLLLGNLIARLALRYNLNVSWLPAYGPEMRGGTANCSVIISKNEIYNPSFKKADILIALNTPSFNKFVKDVSKDGFIIYNSEGLSKKNIFSAPLTQIATSSGSQKAANTAALGYFIKLTRIFGVNEAQKILKQIFPSAYLKINSKSLLAGYNLS